MNIDDAEFIDHEINDLIEGEDIFENYKTIIKKIDKNSKKFQKQLQKAKNALENAVELKVGFGFGRYW